MVAQLVCALVAAGVDEADIGVISPYRAQLRVISRCLAEQQARRAPGELLADRVEVHTVDKFQGRDKDCIILSLVRSNADTNPGSLLRDSRRINVACSRARSRMIFVGSQSTLRGSEVFRKLLGMLGEKSWVFAAPTGADEADVQALCPGGDRPARGADAAGRGGRAGSEATPRHKQGKTVLRDLCNMERPAGSTSFF